VNDQEVNYHIFLICLFTEEIGLRAKTRCCTRIQQQVSQTQTLSFAHMYIVHMKLCVIFSIKTIRTKVLMKKLHLSQPILVRPCITHTHARTHARTHTHTHTHTHLTEFCLLTILIGWLRAGKTVKEDFP